MNFGLSRRKRHDLEKPVEYDAVSPLESKIERIIHPIVLVFFAMLGATVAMSDAVERTFLSKIPGLNPALNLLLGFMFIVSLVIAAYYFLRWVGRRALRLSPATHQVMTLVFLAILIGLSGIQSYSLFKGRTGVSPLVPAAPPPAGLTRLPCPGEDVEFVGYGRNKNNLRVLPGEEFHVDLLLKNTGTVEWHKHYLQRWGQHDNAADLMSEARTQIRMTPVGATTSVRVRLKAPTAPDQYTAFFKVVDENGDPCFQHKKPVSATFNVVDRGDLNVP